MDSGPTISNNYDAIVVGGGIIGCSIAFRLAQGKLRVLVIDRGSVLSEASGAAAGMLAPQGEMLEPDPFFELCMASRALYPAFVAEVEALSGMKVGYRDSGTLLVATDEKEAAELEHIYKAQTQLGLPIERWNRNQIDAAMPGLSDIVRFGLFVPGDHWLDNEKLTRAIVQAAERVGATFVWNAKAQAFNPCSDRVESLRLSADVSKAPVSISAGEFILAAGCWSGHLASTAGIKLSMQPVRGQMLEMESEPALPLVVRSGLHYVVPRSGNFFIAGTTAERVGFAKTVTSEGVHSIIEGVSRFAPFMKRARFRRAWAGLRPDTEDHFPILGRDHVTNLTFATGHFRNGILLAPATAQLIADLILEKKTCRALQDYSPKRFAK